VSALQDLERNAICVPLTSKALYYARQCAEAQPVEKRDRIYRQALAVYGLHFYLLYEHEIESDPERHFLGLPQLGEVATLWLPELEREMECCLVAADGTFAVAEMEIASRLAHVAVRVDADLPAVVLLGFVPTFDSADLPDVVEVAALQPLDRLPQRLEEVARILAWYYGESEIAVQLRRLAAWEDESVTATPVQILRIVQEKRPAQRTIAVKSWLEDFQEAQRETAMTRDLFGEAADEAELRLARFATAVVGEVLEILA
jgi:hypothetical protein